MNGLIHRRHVLRGAGRVALALPLLEAMRPPPARAASPARRFLFFYTPGGTLPEAWHPRRGAGGETDFTLHSILEPLEAHKRHLLGVEGLYLQVARDGFGHTHARGMGALLTGQPTRRGEFETDGGRAGFPDGPSLDQVLARTLGRDTPLPSLELGLRWPSHHLNHGRMTPNNCLCFQEGNVPMPLELDPARVWARLWRGGAVDDAAELRRRARARSVLDAVSAEYTAVARRLGGDDRRKLEAHFTKLREVERSLAAPTPTGAACAPRPLSRVPDHTKDAELPATGKLFMDMLVLGLACDIFRVGTLQWSDSVATNTFPWLGLLDGHHDYQHDRGFQPEALRKIGRFYAEQFAYLVAALAAIEEAGGSLLDNIAVLWGSEIQHPNTHAQNDMPFLLAGRAGARLRTGRWLRFPDRPHNDLLLTLLHTYGIEARTFGSEAHNTGPLAGLA